MTLVLGCRFLKSTTVIADCRVSYDGSQAVDDNLQKLHQIEGKVVLGFAGPLAGAAKVMDRIRQNSVRHERYTSASKLLSDLERWIRWEYRRIENPMDRRNLSFLLASVEAGRPVRSTWRSQDGTLRPTPSWYAGVPELLTVALRPSHRDPEKLVTQRKGMCKVVGVGHHARERIEAQIQELYAFSFGDPVRQAVVVAQALMGLCMEMQIETVGGLFQIALLGRNGIQWVSYGGGDVGLQWEQGRYVQVNHATGARVPLASVWEWIPHSRSAGGTGVFEDPDLRTAINGRQEREDSGQG
jgi:hypothetical protein